MPMTWPCLIHFKIIRNVTNNDLKVLYFRREKQHRKSIFLKYNEMNFIYLLPYNVHLSNRTKYHPF